MLNLWWVYVILYLLLYVIYTQYYKITTKSSNNTSALTSLLRFISGITILIAIPLFEFKIPTDFHTYIFLIFSCVFFAISDRMYTASLKELNVSIYSIMGQLSTIFILIFGVLFLKEKIIFKNILGASLILFANFIVLYKKSKFEWNKYYFYNILANLTFAVGTTLNINISDQFNLPFYIAITFCSSSILIFIFERIKFKEVIKEFKKGNKYAIITVSITDALTSLFILKAYQLQSVTIVAPLCSLKTILNVFVAHVFFKEKTPLLAKLIAAIIIILGITLINI